jgi:hypothetical protein
MKVCACMCVCVDACAFASAYQWVPHIHTRPPPPHTHTHTHTLTVSHTGFRNHPVYLFNGVLMTASFFVARIVLTTYFLFDVFLFHPEEYATLPPAWVFGLSASVVVLTYINTTWFLRMLRGLLRALGGSRSPVAKAPSGTASSPRPRLKAE